MKAVLLVSFLSVLLCAGVFAGSVQRHLPVKIRGSWYSWSGYHTAFYRIKRNGECNSYYEGCTDRGTRYTGFYTQNGDTVSLFFPKDTVVLFLYDRKLYSLAVAGRDLSKEYGLSKTARKTVFGICRKTKHKRLKARRHRYDSLEDDSTEQ